MKWLLVAERKKEERRQGSEAGIVLFGLERRPGLRKF
jgi:hypothetical protein